MSTSFTHCFISLVLPSPRWKENVERDSKYARLQQIFQGQYLQAHETKNRRLCYRQKKTKQRPPSKANKTRQKRNILRQVEILRRDYGYFTTTRLKVFAGVPTHVSDETFRRVVRANWYKYTHSRKKGVSSRKNLIIHSLSRHGL